MMHDPIYPRSPGHRGIDTSIEAAEAIESVSGRLRLIALRHIRAAGRSGHTTNELAAQASIDRGSIQPRTSELRQLHRIRDSGQRRLNANGKRAIVWIAVETESG